MLPNPFTPASIAVDPKDFFGRSSELELVEKALLRGSVAIQGPIGIGKSSLLARARLLMESYKSEPRAQVVVAVGDRDIDSVENAARLLLESFVEIDEKSRKVAFKLGGLFEVESAEICRNFAEGRHLANLKRIVEDKTLSGLVGDSGLLILATDEADKCPVPLTRVIRAMATHTQQNGITQLRFALAGVSPFFQQMVDEDPGISRFFHRTVSLEPMTLMEATDLIETKLKTLGKEAEAKGLPIRVDPSVVSRIVALSGGHPHLLQLLGSHLIESEEEDPDDILDARDLLTSLERICYEDRGHVYETTLHQLELHGHLGWFQALLENLDGTFPSRIKRRLARKLVPEESLKWLVEHNILSMPDALHYGLVDEFIRVRILLDQSEVNQRPVLSQDLLRPERMRPEDLYLFEM